jgi:CheY-like chemotaxis protein
MTRRILFVDDDSLALKQLSTTVRDAGYLVDGASGVPQALTLASRNRYDLVILDVMMPATGLDQIEAKGGFEAGVALARRLIAAAPETKVVGVSQAPARDVRRWFSQNAHGFWDKAELLWSSDLLVRRVHGVFHQAERIAGLRSFIVHGHDHETLNVVRTYLVNEFGMPEPTVLTEVAWRGRTLIEKFEQVADSVDVVFVLMTPDDFVLSEDEQRVGQARPNVLLELGYFLGRTARLRGHVIILTRGPVGIPTDLSGVGYIDITNGITAAAPELRRELTAIVDNVWHDGRA